MCIIKLLYACCSPLHITAKSGLVGVVKELINRGADLNIRDADGMSWLFVQLLVIGMYLDILRHSNSVLMYVLHPK